MSEKPNYEELLQRLHNLEESERVYRSLVENTSDLLYRTDLQGKIVFISPSVLEMSGYTNEEAIGMNMAQEVYLYPEEREKFLRALRKNGKITKFEAQLKRKDGSKWWASTTAHFFKDRAGNIAGVEGITRDITELKLAREAQAKLILELKAALEKVHTLSGLLPICSSCKKIRDDKGYWNQIEAYIHKHAEVEFSHGLCPDCAEKLYGREGWYVKMKHEKD